jgi:lipoprotein-anchoring transpeptidase ErfK/SrfK
LLVAFAAFVAVAYGREPGVEAVPTGVVLPTIPSSASRETAPVSAAAGSSTPIALSSANGVARYMAVAEPVAARAQPDASAPIVGRLSSRTPEGTTNTVLALARVERGGTLWIKARLPVLPNNTVGWIPRASLGGYNSVNTRVVIDTAKLTLTLFRFGKPIFAARVGVGQAQWPTPRGKFYIRNKLTRYSSPTYGPVAFGTSARSAVLTDWPAGGYVGIHGTNQPALIPGRVSHGCVRMRNTDILRLADLMQPGTPLTIE